MKLIEHLSTRNHVGSRPLFRAGGWPHRPPKPNPTNAVHYEDGVPLGAGLLLPVSGASLNEGSGLKTVAGRWRRHRLSIASRGARRVEAELAAGPTPARQLLPGQLRRIVRLSSEGVYRVCEVGDELVKVEVVRAPGLAPGQRFTFTRRAVEQMEFVAEQ